MLFMLFVCIVCFVLCCLVGRQLLWQVWMCGGLCGLWLNMFLRYLVSILIMLWFCVNIRVFSFVLIVSCVMWLFCECVEVCRLRFGFIIGGFYSSMWWLFEGVLDLVIVCIGVLINVLVCCCGLLMVVEYRMNCGCMLQNVQMCLSWWIMLVMCELNMLWQLCILLIIMQCRFLKNCVYFV